MIYWFYRTVTTSSKRDKKYVMKNKAMVVDKTKLRNVDVFLMVNEISETVTKKTGIYWPDGEGKHFRNLLRKVT